MPQTSLVPMGRFVSTGSTQIFAWTVMEDTYLALSKPAPVESALFLRDFRALSACGPYTCSVLGVVACVGEMRISASQLATRSSAAGAFIQLTNPRSPATSCWEMGRRWGWGSRQG